MVSNYVSGYYEVGKEQFVNKTAALIRSGQLNISPTWHFHSDIFVSQPWQTDVVEDLDRLYQQRARQLRDQYDFISLAFSGGADSFTALKSFLDSDTYVDEVFVRWPIKATSGKYTPSRDTRPANILSEWQLTILPMLDRLRNLLHPQTQVTVIDWSDRILKDEAVDIEWSHNQDFFNPGVRIKHDTVTDLTQRAIDSGKRVAILFGVDKPQICVQNGNVYCYFLDKLAHTHAHHPYDQYSELFFWSRHCPEIVVSQCKIVYQHLRLRPGLADLIDWSQPYDANKKHVWNQIVGSLIYPGYSAGWFQAKKGTSLIFNEVDEWMIEDHMHSRFMQSWQHVIRNHMASVPDRYIERRDGLPIGYVGFFDQMYLLGPLVDQ